LPTGNGDYEFFNLKRGQILAGKDFGNQPLPSEIHGTLFFDANGNAGATCLPDAADTGVANIVVFADLNNDGKLSVLEPSAVTDRFGRFAIKNVPPGNFTVREAVLASMTTTCNSGTSVVVQSGAILPNINVGFGAVQLLD